MNKFFLIRKFVLHRKRRAIFLENEPVDWKKAGESFKRLCITEGSRIRRLADARTYRDLYLKDGIKPLA